MITQLLACQNRSITKCILHLVYIHFKSDAEFLLVGVDTHVLKCSTVRKRNTVCIRDCLYFLSVFEHNILAQVIIKLM